jgi:integrase
MVLLAALTSLRWGELTALRRHDIDLETATVSVRRQHVELDTGKIVTTAPKSAAGIRTVAIPAAVLGPLREFLDLSADDKPDALLFTGGRGGSLRRSNFRREVGWYKAVAANGMPGLHFHDLRHSGDTLAAASGASLRDLMDCMGHDSVRAAMIYQHKTATAGQAIADAISGAVQAVRTPVDDDG